MYNAGYANGKGSVQVARVTMSIDNLDKNLRPATITVSGTVRFAAIASYKSSYKVWGGTNAPSSVSISCTYSGNTISVAALTGANSGLYNFTAEVIYYAD